MYYKAAKHRLKPMFFFQLTLPSNTLVLTLYLSGVRIMVVLVMDRTAENIEEMKKTKRRKRLKSEEELKLRIRVKSNNSNIHLWFYIIICLKTWFETKFAYTIKFC